MKKILLFFLLVVSISILYFTKPLISLYFSKDKKEIISEEERIVLTLKKDLLFEELGTLLIKKKLINNSKNIDGLISYKGFSKEYLKRGKYTFYKSWSTNKLVNQLYIMRKQNIIDLYIPSSRNLELIVRKINSQLTIDTLKLLDLFKDPDLAKKYGFTNSNFRTFIIPNTYEVYSSLDENGIIELIRKEYKKFWNLKRIKKANDLGLSQSEVTILASIVQMEQQIKFDEHSKIAGLYINRLKRGMKLQADPTVKYALNKPNLKRLYYSHLKEDSPYNTYMYKGLPPGPICIPDSRVIDAVLNHSKHNYIFMCAEPSYSGYHNFSSTNKEHEKFKKLYTDWLAKEGIR
ncbi:MAG: endolytic transglycosylase MltG [Flavobacteriales bacterium]|nr:endolytic transglycosylase MltG [Flavobacteriales bacterium]